MSHSRTSTMCAARGAGFGLLAMALLGGCDGPEQDKFISAGGISPDPTAIIEGAILYIGPQPQCDYDASSRPIRVRGRIILTMFEYDNPPPPEGSATTSVNLLALEGERLFQLTDCLPKGREPDYSQRILRSVAYSWPRLTLFADRAVDYQIRGFYDYDEDMIPFFSVSRVPTYGDIAGAAVADLQDASKGFLRITLPQMDKVPKGAIVNGITVALGNPVWTERPLFRLGDERRLAATTPFNPALGVVNGTLGADPIASLRTFRKATCKDPNGDGVTCGLSLFRFGAEDAMRLSNAGVQIDLANSERYAFYTQPVDIKRPARDAIDPMIPDGVPDLHPFLGGTGLPWYSPMVLLQRVPEPEYAAVEAAAKIPRVIMVGSVLFDDTTKLPIKSSFVNTPVPIAIPPIAAVELAAGKPECRVPYFPPGSLPQAMQGRVAHCGEMPTGRYSVNVLNGVAGGTVTAASGFPSTSESRVALSGGRYSSQLWSIPNEFADAAQVGSENVMADQGMGGTFVIHDPTPTTASTCDLSAAQTLGNCNGPLVINEVPGGDGTDNFGCLADYCCAEIAHLCSVPVCEKVETADGFIAKGPTTTTLDMAGKEVPDCVPFEMPRQCCPTQ